jgi:potassium uptake Trk family protein
VEACANLALDMIIVGGTFLASILLISGSRGNLKYIDALLFASGANSQAGLNPVDVNELNTFQQIILYIFPLMTNPITLHSSVVFLRLYWFEKRFQGLVREARNRRASMSKSKSHAKTDPDRAERGVNGRRITILRGSGKKAGLNNDGSVVVGSAYQHHPVHPGMEAEAGPSTLRPSSEVDSSADLIVDVAPGSQSPDRTGSAQISFAPVVKKSDGMGLARTKFGSHQEENGFPAPLSPSMSQDDEILRIPNPREAEQGIKPRRIAEGTAPEGDDGEHQTIPGGNANGASASDTESSKRKGKEPVRGPSAIRIEEPEPPWKEDIGDEARAIKNVFSALQFRCPRFLTKSRFRHVNDSVSKDGDDSQDDSDTRGWRAVRSKTLQNLKTALSQPEANDAPYLSWTPTMGRNSQFLGLTLEQREELGGIEYRSLRTLFVILVTYFWSFHFLGLFCMLGFIKTQDSYAEAVRRFGVSPTWWAFWTSNLSFMDVGFSLTPDSMISFQSSAFVLMILWFLIIIGNTGFPIMLRAIIWILSKVVPKDTGLWQELRFLLDHPRRCFTLLFPSSATWWLFWILVILNGLDLIFFIILDVCLFLFSVFCYSSFFCISSFHPTALVCYLVDELVTNIIE